MKIVSLNTWGGRAMHPLMHFFKQYGPGVDVFCLQEMHETTQQYREEKHPDEYVRWDLLGQTCRVLPDHDGYFASFEDNPDRMSVATFVRQDLPVQDTEDRIIHWPEVLREEGSRVISPRMAQLVLIGSDDAPDNIMIVNYHGAWSGDNKGDTPERIEQSQRLIEFCGDFDRVVLCGDFNIVPGTESYRMLREQFVHELVVDRHWRTTRTPLYRHFEREGYDPYADYMFVRGVDVVDFRVLPDLVSDHAALFADMTW